LQGDSAVCVNRRKDLYLLFQCSNAHDCWRWTAKLINQQTSQVATQKNDNATTWKHTGKQTVYLDLHAWVQPFSLSHQWLFIIVFMLPLVDFRVEPQLSGLHLPPTMKKTNLLELFGVLAQSVNWQKYTIKICIQNANWLHTSLQSTALHAFSSYELFPC